MAAVYLSVQGAAQRLGVSPHTIRRWTDSGFLPCNRTSGGHRRVKQEDVDELIHLIGGRNHLSARLGAERQLESLTAAASLLVEPRASGALPELARHIAALLDADRCVIAETRPRHDRLRVLAVWDAAGEVLPVTTTLEPAHRPLVARVLQGHGPAVVNVGDPRADPAEVAVLRRDGDKCILLVPVLDGDRVAGLLEILDHERERKLSPQELRLARAAAALVATALRGDEAAERLRRAGAERRALKRALAVIGEGQPAFTAAAQDEAGILRAAAALATTALHGVACVASHRGASAGASDPEAAAGHAASGAEAHVLAASAPSAAGDVTLTLTLGRPPGDGEAEVLGLVASLAASALSAAEPR